MKKYLIPVILCLALLLTMPGVALAKKHHDTSTENIKATMTVKAIEDTALYDNVFPLDAGYNVLLPPDLSALVAYLSEGGDHTVASYLAQDPSPPLALYLDAHPNFELAQFMENPQGYWADYLLDNVAWWNVVDRTIVGKIVGKNKGKLKGSWEFTYSGILNPLQAGTINGTLNITTKKGDISCTAIGTTAMVDMGTHPKKGDYIDVVLSIDVLTVTGGTGKYEGISGEGYLGGFNQPLRLFLDETGQHVTSIKGKMTLNLNLEFPDDDEDNKKKGKKHGDD